MGASLRIDEVLETVVNAYEQAIRRSCDLQRSLGRVLAFEPARTILDTTAGLTRDVAAVQVSAARWLLDS
jgi:hypothetical protein